MIRFACPTCGNSMTASPSKAGSIMPCTACNQLVQVPAPAPHSSAAHPKPRELSRAREGGRAFWALCRLSLRGLCFAVILLALGSYAIEVNSVNEANARTSIAVQTLVWVLGAYYFVRILDDVGKSFEDVVSRVRGRKK